LVSKADHALQGTGRGPVERPVGSQRRHLAQLHHHPWQRVDITISDATHAIHDALHAGTWIPGQLRRLRQLAPGTWDQSLAGVLGAGPDRPDDGPGHPAVEIAIYPDVVWLAASSLRARSTSHHAAT
jgi:hypothetical protein